MHNFGRGLVQLTGTFAMYHVVASWVHQVEELSSKPRGDWKKTPEKGKGQNRSRTGRVVLV